MSQYFAVLPLLYGEILATISCFIILLIIYKFKYHIFDCRRQLVPMLHGLGYRCWIRVCVWHGYYSIFVSFSIYLKDWSVIPMSEYVSDTGASGKMKSPCNIGWNRTHMLLVDQNIMCWNAPLLTNIRRKSYFYGGDFTVCDKSMFRVEGTEGAKVFAFILIFLEHQW